MTKRSCHFCLIALFVFFITNTEGNVTTIKNAFIVSRDFYPTLKLPFSQVYTSFMETKLKEIVLCILLFKRNKLLPQQHRPSS